MVARSADQEAELRFVFGDYRPGDPMRAYYEGLIDSMRSRCSHATIMAGQCAIPTGYGFDEGVRIVGGALKSIAPFVAFVPGFGTVVAVAMSTAGSLALGERIDRALVGIASDALPPGVPRMAFDGGADITLAAVNGDDVGAAALRVSRRAAEQLGGDRAVSAFDAGVAAARGERLSDSAIAALRAQAGQAGTAAASAFDAGLVLARGGTGGAAALAAAREYLARAGGGAAVVAFDTGVALAQGQALQEAGFSALRSLVKGNSMAEKAWAYTEKIAQAARDGKDVKDVLVDALADEIVRAGGSALQKPLNEAIERIQQDRSLAELGSLDLARILGTSEEVARAAQAITRGGGVDTGLKVRLVGVPLKQTTTLELLGRYIDPLGIRAAAFGTGTTVEAGARLAQPIRDAAFRSDSVQMQTSLLRSVLPTKAPVAAPPPVQLVQAPRAASRSTLGQDVALGVVIATAAGALLWWSRGLKKA